MIELSKVLVGPVNTLEQVVGYYKIGADAVFITIDDRTGFCESYQTEFDKAVSFRWSVETEIGVAISWFSEWENFKDHIERVKVLEPDFACVSADLLRDARKCEYLVEHTDWPILVYGLTLEHDDDPVWLRNVLVDLKLKVHRDVVFVVSIFPEYSSGLEFLRFDAGEFEEDVVIDDVRALADDFSVCFNIGKADETTYNWFFNRLSNDVGLAVFLAKEPGRGLVAELSPSDAKVLLEHVRDRSEPRASGR